eukprot:scaffold3134_cov414-Prasinococcus_capsulatus_cf.AAC.8
MSEGGGVFTTTSMDADSISPSGVATVTVNAYVPSTNSPDASISSTRPDPVTVSARSGRKAGTVEHSGSVVCEVQDALPGPTVHWNIEPSGNGASPMLKADKVRTGRSTDSGCSRRLIAVTIRHGQNKNGDLISLQVASRNIKCRVGYAGIFKIAWPGSTCPCIEQLRLRIGVDGSSPR